MRRPLTTPKTILRDPATCAACGLVGSHANADHCIAALQRALETERNMLRLADQQHAPADY